MSMSKWMGSAVVVAALVLGACDDDDDNGTAPVDQARVRVVHASPDAPAVDVRVDDAVALSNVPFFTASAYLPVAAGARRLRVNAAGTATTVIDATPTLDANTDYTVIAAGRLASISPILLTDDNTAPTAGNVKVRVVHGAASAPAVDVYVTAPGGDIATATPVLSGVAFRAASAYLSVPAGTYRVRVTLAGTKTVAIDTGANGIPVVAGRVYTAIARDNVGGGAPFTVELLTDRQ
jgi:hypothetical protein